MSHPFDADTATPETPDSSAFHRLEPGSEVGGRFEILKEIGTGGSSVVYAVRAHFDLVESRLRRIAEGS